MAVGWPARETDIPFEGRLLGGSYNVGRPIKKISFVNYDVARSFDNNVSGDGLALFATTGLIIDIGVQFTNDRNQPVNHSILALIGVVYNLSKRTQLYAQAGIVDNHGAMNTGQVVDGPLHGHPGRRSVWMPELDLPLEVAIETPREKNFPAAISEIASTLRPSDLRRSLCSKPYLRDTPDHGPVIDRSMYGRVAHLGHDLLCRVSAICNRSPDQHVDDRAIVRLGDAP